MPRSTNIRTLSCLVPEQAGQPSRTAMLPVYLSQLCVTSRRHWVCSRSSTKPILISNLANRISNASTTGWLRIKSTPPSKERLNVLFATISRHCLFQSAPRSTILSYSHCDQKTQLQHLTGTRSCSTRTGEIAASPYPRYSFFMDVSESGCAEAVRRRGPGMSNARSVASNFLTGLCSTRFDTKTTRMTRTSEKAGTRSRVSSSKHSRLRSLVTVRQNRMRTRSPC